MKAVLLLAAMGAVATADPSRSAAPEDDWEKLKQMFANERRAQISQIGPECKPAGGLFFEVDQRADSRVKRFTATTKMFANGSWTTEVYETDGSLARFAWGCLDTTRVNSIRDDLQSAKWTVSHRDVSCRLAESPRFTVYKWKRRTLYTDRTCNTNVLDRESRQVLDRIELLLHIPNDLDGAELECGMNPLARGCL